MSRPSATFVVLEKPHHEAQSVANYASKHLTREVWAFDYITASAPPQNTAFKVPAGSAQIKHTISTTPIETVVNNMPARCDAPDSLGLTAITGAHVTSGSTAASAAVGGAVDAAKTVGVAVWAHWER